MLEELFSAEVRLAVINYNEVLEVLHYYFDEFSNTKMLTTVQLTEPENSQFYCLPFAGTWEKYGKKGTLAFWFNCIKSGSTYELVLELHGLEPHREVVHALDEANFSFISYRRDDSPAKTIIKLDLVR